MNYHMLLCIASLMSALEIHAMHITKKSRSEPLSCASSSDKNPQEIANVTTFGHACATEEATHLFTIAFTHALFIEKLISSERDTEYKNIVETLINYAQRNDLEHAQLTVLKQLQEAEADLFVKVSHEKNSQRTDLYNDTLSIASAYLTAKSPQVRKAAYLVISNLVRQGHPKAISYATDFIHKNHLQPLSDEIVHEIMPLVVNLAYYHATKEQVASNPLTRELLTFANHYSGHSESDIRLLALRCINLFIGIHPYAKQCARNALSRSETGSPSIKELLETMQNKIKLTSSISSPL